MRCVVMACLLCALAAGARLAAQEVILDKLVAVVNGDVIMASQVRAVRLLHLMPGADQLDDAGVITQLIERHLILEEVARFPPALATDAAVTAARNTWRASLPSNADVPALLARVGMTDVELAAWLRDDLRINAYLDRLFAASSLPTRDDIAEYFRLHQAEFAVQGAVPPLPAVEAEVRRRVTAERRDALVRSWLNELKTRANISRSGG